MPKYVSQVGLLAVAAFLNRLEDRRPRRQQFGPALYADANVRYRTLPVTREGTLASCRCGVDIVFELAVILTAGLFAAGYLSLS